MVGLVGENVRCGAGEDGGVAWGRRGGRMGAKLVTEPHVARQGQSLVTGAKYSRTDVQPSVQLLCGPNEHTYNMTANW